MPPQSQRPPYIKKRKAALVAALSALIQEYGWAAMKGAIDEARWPPQPETERARRKRLREAREETFRRRLKLEEVRATERARVEQETARRREIETWPFRAMLLQRSRVAKAADRLRIQVRAVIGGRRARLRYASKSLEYLGRRLSKTPERLAFEARRNEASLKAVDARMDTFLRRVGPVLLALKEQRVVQREIARELNERGLMKPSGRPWRMVDVGQTYWQLRARLQRDPDFMKQERNHISSGDDA